MKKGYFNSLSLKVKETIVEEFARPLFSIEYYDHRIDLFSLDSILIERYSNIDTSEVEKITEASFGDLDKYLSRIVIGSLKKSLDMQR